MEAYCSYCGEEQPIRQTVPWQANLCKTCGHSVTTNEPHQQG